MHLGHDLNPKNWGKKTEKVAEVAVAPIVYPTKIAVDAVKYGAQVLGSMFDKPDSGDSTPDTTTPEQKITDAKADSVKRRRALYATKGGSLGEEVEKVGSTFGNGRGTLFGN